MTQELTPGQSKRRTNMKASFAKLDQLTTQRFLKKVEDNPKLNESPSVKRAIQEIENKNPKVVAAIRNTTLLNKSFDSEEFEAQLNKALGVAQTDDHGTT